MYASKTQARTETRLMAFKPDPVSMNKPSYYDPQAILADWRALEQRATGAQKLRFQRLIASLEQDHTAPVLPPVRPARKTNDKV